MFFCARTTIFLRVSCCVVVFFLACVSLCQTQYLSSVSTSDGTKVRFRVSIIGVFPGDKQSFANDINEDGYVVGVSRVGYQNQYHAFLWRNGSMMRLATLPGGKQSEAFKINDKNQIIGWSETKVSNKKPHTQYFPVLWNDRKVRPLVSGFGYIGGAAQGINNKGIVAGSSLKSVPKQIGSPRKKLPERAVVWSGYERMQEIGTPGGAVSRSRDINESGNVVGAYDAIIDGSSASVERAFLFKRSSGCFIDVSPDKRGSVAESINNHGKVVGSYSLDGVFVRAFLYYNGKKYDLGTLKNMPYSRASDVNDLDQVVGYCNDKSGGNDAAFIWERGSMKNLNHLIKSGSGWNLSRANSINNKGQIVGVGYFNGVKRAFLLTPLR